VLAMIVRALRRVGLRRHGRVLLGAGALTLAVIVLAVVAATWRGSTHSGPSPGPRSGCSERAAEVGPSQSARKHPPDLTLSFDAEPAYCEWDSIQPGYACTNGSVDRASPAQPASAAFARDDSPGNIREGKYSARVVLAPGDHAAYSCRAEAVFAIKNLNEGEGSGSWWAWSWKLPLGWRGTDSWGMLFEFTTNASLWPSYGMLNFDASSRGSLQLRLHTGLTPNPGSSTYNAAYEKKVTLLGPTAPRPMPYGKWLDFYMHVVWHSRSAGVLELWYRAEGQQTFTKLYSDVPGGHALIQVAPHPTLLYNTANGVPGENGKPALELEGGFYRGNATWANEYWWDGMRRRQNEGAVMAGFPPSSESGRASPSPFAPSGHSLVRVRRHRAPNVVSPSSAAG
jgi:hypothetical protein